MIPVTSTGDRNRLQVERGQADGVKTLSIRAICRNLANIITFFARYLLRKSLTTQRKMNGRGAGFFGKPLALS